MSTMISPDIAVRLLARELDRGTEPRHWLGMIREPLQLGRRDPESLDPELLWGAAMVELHHPRGLDGPRLIHIIEWLESAAKRGNISAIGHLGMVLVDQEHGPLDLSRGLALLQEAADEGHGAAAFILGTLQLTAGIEHADDAMMWIRVAAEAGHVPAKLRLGSCYLDGMGVEPDAQRAFFWFARAADHGHPSALSLLGMCYEEGIGVEADAAMAFALYKESAELGDPDAQALVGLFLEEGNGVARDSTEAVSWYRMAAAGGSATAALALANCLQHGIGTVQNLSEAVVWMARAAEGGSLEAAYQLGLCYLHGYGIPKSSEAARVWLQTCAELGHTDGAYAYGVLLARGEGGTADTNEARKWLEFAAQNGHPEAAEKLEVLPTPDARPQALLDEFEDALLAGDALEYERSAFRLLAALEKGASGQVATAIHHRTSFLVEALPVDRAAIASLVISSLANEGKIPEALIQESRTLTTMAMRLGELAEHGPDHPSVRTWLRALSGLVESRTTTIETDVIDELEAAIRPFRGTGLTGDIHSCLQLHRPQSLRLLFRGDNVAWEAAVTGVRVNRELTALITQARSGEGTSVVSGSPALPIVSAHQLHNWRSIWESREEALRIHDEADIADLELVDGVRTAIVRERATPSALGLAQRPAPSLQVSKRIDGAEFDEFVQHLLSMKQP